MPTSNPHWTIQIIVVVLSSTGIWSTIRWFFDRRDRKRQHKIADRYRSIAETYSIMMALQVDTTADRVVLLKSENGGGIPRPGVQVKSSVIAEVENRSIEKVANKWFNVPIDSDYANILATVSSQGVHVVKKEALSEGSALRDIYEADGVTWSLVYRLGMCDEYMLYLSMNFRTELEDGHDCEAYLKPSERTSIRDGINRLTRIMKEHHDVVAQIQV